MSVAVTEDNHLAGMLLLAMPAMPDPRFARSVIYLCAHSAEGAMGIVVNQPATGVTFTDVVQQLGIEAGPAAADVKVRLGGPVENTRGFVLHSADFAEESTLRINDSFALTATVDVLKAIATGTGPRQHIFALGYAGWGAGQLDSEIQANGWLIAPPDLALVFAEDDSSKWERALRAIGVEPGSLSTTAGHA